MSFIKFPVPKCSLVIDKVADLNDDKVIKTIDGHKMSKVIQFVCDDQQAINRLSEMFVSSNTFSYFLIYKMPIYLLIDHILISEYIRKGKLYAISINSQDNHDQFILLPNGHLILSLTSFTYHRFGLIGRKSILNGKRSVDKYLVEIDVLDEKFKTESKFYKRVYESFKRNEMCFDVVLKWEISDQKLIQDSISSSSIINYFEYLKKTNNELNKMTINRCAPLLKTFSNSNVPMLNLKNEFDFEEIKELIDWFGAQLCQVECQPQDIEISTFNVDNNKFCNVHCLQVSGLFTFNDVKQIMNYFEENHLGHFSAIIINGFEEAAISWSGNRNEHGKNMSGENLYGIMFYNHNYVVWRITDEYDFAIEKM